MENKGFLRALVTALFSQNRSRGMSSIPARTIRRRANEDTGITKARRAKAKRKNVARLKYVQRRKSWRRKRAA